jgi:hypothetical protein
MPHDATPWDECKKQEASALMKDILELTFDAFERSMLASSVTFRGTTYSVGQYLIVEVDHWTRHYQIGKIVQCVLDADLKGEKVKFVLRQYSAQENIAGVITVKDKTGLCVTAISDIADYHPLTALKGRSSTIVLHHYISSCPHA